MASTIDDKKGAGHDEFGVEAAAGHEKGIDGSTHIKHLEHTAGITTDSEWQQILQDAIESEAQERALGWKAALKLYPQACFWSFAISLCIVM